MSNASVPMQYALICWECLICLPPGLSRASCDHRGCLEPIWYMFIKSRRPRRLLGVVQTGLYCALCWARVKHSATSHELGKMPRLDFGIRFIRCDALKDAAC